MPMNIRSEEVNRVAEKVAALARVSKTEAVRRAQRAGRYDREPGVRIVAGYRPRTRGLLIEDARGIRSVSADVIGPDERRHLFRRAPGGLKDPGGNQSELALCGGFAADLLPESTNPSVSLGAQ